MRSDVELIDEWRKSVEEDMRVDGYVVMGSRLNYKVGDVVKEDTGDWTVVGEATYEDAIRQFEYNKRFLNPDEDFVPPPKDYRFYKTVLGARQS